MGNLLKLISDALNQIPKYDANFEKQLKCFEQGSFGFHVIDMNKTIYLVLHKKQFVFTETKPGMMTATLSGTVQDYYHFIKGYLIGEEAFHFQIEGDQESVYQLRNLFTQIDLDWEEIISEFVGDEAAYEVGYRLKQMKKKFRSLAQRHTENLSEFVTEELKITPSVEELNDFYEDIQKITYDVDRVEAKLKFFKSRGHS